MLFKLQVSFEMQERNEVRKVESIHIHIVYIYIKYTYKVYKEGIFFHIIYFDYSGCELFKEEAFISGFQQDL